MWMVDNVTCGGYTFNSNFDSGNLAKVVLFRFEADILVSEDVIQKEINVWTRPDCAGTEYENGNRSWFFFSIRGGEKNRTIKINVMNLNKQSKLYSQGFYPVTRIGDNGKWERLKEPPTFYLNDENFVLSFIHKPGENNEINIYYAFTYPFTYNDCQKQLERFDSIYEKHPLQLDYILEKIATDQPEKLSVQQIEDGNANTIHSIPLDRTSKQSDETNDKCNNDLLSVYGNMNNDDMENEIYYHRELLINSVEGRRVDLLTISSFHGIQYKRECRLQQLFPDGESKSRCLTFKNKKVILVSSRVHPGETPASFILNGFLKMLLDRKNLLATHLRRLYVFKIVPFLNPDGVYNGCYRSDTLGHNLNRVYLNPSIERHPTIYAVRKLIRYYHFNEDVREFIDIADEPNTSSSSSSASRSHSVESDKIISIVENEAEASTSKVVSDSIQSTSSRTVQCVFVDKFINEIKPIMEQPLTASDENSKLHIKKPSDIEQPFRKPKGFGILQKSNRFVNQKKDQSAMSSRQSSTLGGRSIKTASTFSAQNSLFTGNINFTADTVNNNRTATENSNMFLYIDLHGHASKKGIFMYGNHLPNIAESVECMLLPRLMSLNCHHFHFDACVFSERNMYHKGKRDGLSKEGSGRVAIYKAIGLIKSYTLEGNYNTGRYVNILPPKLRDPSLMSKKATHIGAPKYTPIIFEDVGRALVPSILDLTNSNPVSRIQNSGFRTIQGLRNHLRHEVDRGLSRQSTSAKIPLTTKTKRIKPNSAPCCRRPSGSAEISKENKIKDTAVGVKPTIYGKKEGPTGRKKGKVLCDTVLTKLQRDQTHSATTSLTVPVPSKRPKVCPANVTTIDGQKLSDKASTSLPASPIAIKNPIKTVSRKAASALPASELLETVPPITAIPCCSRSIASSSSSSLSLCQQPSHSSASTSYHLSSTSSSAPKFINKKSGNFAGMSNALGATIAAVPSGNSGRKTLKKCRPKSSSNLVLTSTSSSTGISLSKPLKRSMINKESVKLKKKKSLKSTDTTLKRKKSRVF